jgi:hypothetical protein
MERTVGARGERGRGLEYQVVLVRTQRAFVEPQHIAALIVQGNRLQAVAGKRLFQRFADRGFRIAGSCDTLARLHS